MMLEATMRIINYKISPDIAIILSEFKTSPIFGITHVAELAEVYQEVLFDLTQVRCNKIAAQMLGSRLEESIRVLGDIDFGLLTLDVARPSQRNLISTHAMAMTRNLGQVASYLRRQSSVGWLRHSFRLEGSAPLQYKILDDGLLACVNALVLALGGSSHLLLLRPVSYGSYAVDVKRVAEGLGTISEIYDSPGLLMQMAHAIQASSLHLHTELALILQGKYSGRFAQDSNNSRKILYMTNATTETSSNTCAVADEVTNTNNTDDEKANRKIENDVKSGVETPKHDDNPTRTYISKSTSIPVEVVSATEKPQTRGHKWSLSRSIYNFFKI